MQKPIIAKIQERGNNIFFYQVTQGKKVIATGLTNGYQYVNNKFTTSGLWFENVSDLITF